MISKWMRNLSDLAPTGSRVQEDHADLPTGPGARGLLRADQFHRKPLARCSSLRYPLLCQQTRHLPQTSPRSVLSLLLLLACRNSHQIASLSREVDIHNENTLAKQRFPNVHVDRFFGCSEFTKVATCAFKLKMSFFEYFLVFFCQTSSQTFLQQIFCRPCNLQSLANSRGKWCISTGICTISWWYHP